MEREFLVKALNDAMQAKKPIALVVGGQVLGFSRVHRVLDGGNPMPLEVLGDVRRPMSLRSQATVFVAPESVGAVVGQASRVVSS